MLKKFFMNMLSSFMGAWIALVLFGVVAVLVCVGLVAKFAATGSTVQSVSKNSVMVIDLSGEIEEREVPSEFDYMSMARGDLSRPQTLSSLTMAISEAKENKNVAAIYLKCNGVTAPLATLNALRESISDFRSSGKKVIAYAENFMMSDYYVASVADSVFMNPAGMMAIKGIGGTSMYFKNLFDKLGVQFQVVKVGTFKSAVEPYILNEMSQPARAQLDTLYGTLWKTVRENISQSRKKVTPDKIDSLVSRDFIFTQPASFSLKAGLVDRLFYERSMDSVVAAIVGIDKDKINYVDPSLLVGQTDWGQAYSSKRQVAVLYASGEIVDGGKASTINYQNLVPVITKLAEDDNVKGLVLRVNSPGGAVFGSEQIGEALDYFQSKGKPLAVSMGAYAASGGYWISCGADRIFADPFTITGSIGIFGLIPNAAGLMEKVGVTPQAVYTNPGAEFPTLFSPMSESQQAVMQKYVERGYDKFVARVASGRHMSEARVRVIGEGRVWSAPKAVEIGLVDALGSLDDALEWVAGKADIRNDYDVSAYPTVEASVWDFLPELQNIRLAKAVARALAGDYDDLAVKFATAVLSRKPVQALMPPVDARFAGSVPMQW